MDRQYDVNFRIFAALLSGVLIYGLAMGTSYPLLGLMLSDEVSDAWNGVSVSATGFGLILGVILLPTIHRRIGAGSAAVLGVVVMAGSLFALSQVANFWVLFVFRVLLGVGANLMFVVTETGLNTLSDAKSRGRLLGLYSMLTGLGFIVGPALVALVPDQPLVLLTLCACIAACATIPFVAVRAVLDHTVAVDKRTHYLPSIRALPFAFILLFIASAVDAVIIGLLPVISIRSGFSAGEGAVFVTVFHVGLVAGQPVVGRLLDIWGRRRTILACILLSVSATALLALGGGQSFFACAVLMFGWGAANFGLYTAGLTLIGDRFAGMALSAATGSFALVYALAAILAPFMAGLGLETINAAGFYALTSALYLCAYVWALHRFQPLEPAMQR